MGRVEKREGTGMLLSALTPCPVALTAIRVRRQPRDPCGRPSFRHRTMAKKRLLHLGTMVASTFHIGVLLNGRKRSWWRDQIIRPAGETNQPA